MQGPKGEKGDAGSAFAATGGTVNNILSTGNGTTLASALNVPAGSYVVMAQVNLEGRSANRGGTCRINVPGTDAVGSANYQVGQRTEGVSILWADAITAPGTVSVSCIRATTGQVDAFSSSIVAIKVRSVS